MPPAAGRAAPSPALRAAYRRTAYEAAGLIARVGRRSPALDALLRRAGTRQAAFVGASNPRSRRMPDGWNRRLHDRLRRMARRLSLAEGSGRDRRWAERHLLLAADPRRAAVLARRFRQNAIVVLRTGQPARLLVLR
ncbi:DUF3293 domain-containing protein [Roseomonas sp. NAR14]|uniref:DUF3293 domain-containing protein n=1 Tax=Roseomonas acroporae TaxID=2937791 RepID=A0A9X1Y726_9PROT|nr:DUF3293 domain-containing protein [Roseomonas acroporae]MCK8784315.1 DUF3293 domain-containing protein [Roseomonas acroporae]